MQTILVFILKLAFGTTNIRAPVGGCTLNNLTPIAPFQIEINKYAEDIPYGQCTEWADGRYYQLTGYHANFNGDAYEWDNLASMDKEWVVSDYPLGVPSIFVLERYVDSAQFGHVGVVEYVSADNNYVCTSNWNYPYLGEVTMKVFKIDNGMKFISHA